MKHKLALVRGHFFSPEEIAMYQPLSDEFDITFISSVKGSRVGEGNPRVTEVECLDRLSGLSFSGLYRKAEGLWNNVTGVIPEYLLGLRRALEGFDIVQAFDYNYLMTYQLAKLKKELGFKLVPVHWENIPFARDGKPLCRFVKYRVYGNADAFFSMSERAKASLVLEGVDESKIDVVGFGVDTSRFKPDEEAGRSLRTKFGIGHDEKVILFVGRVRASKGIFELVYAAKRLLTDPDLSGQRIRVVLVGKGPGEAAVDRMTSRLGIAGNVLRIGHIPHDEIPGALNMADIFCLPSLPRKYWQEQLGMVFLEAMACGKPIVSTLSGSIPEVVEDAGILVQPNDHTALYNALRNLLTDAALGERLRQKGMQRVESNFSLYEVSQRMRHLFRRLVSERAA